MFSHDNKKQEARSKKQEARGKKKEERRKTIGVYDVDAQNIQEERHRQENNCLYEGFFGEEGADILEAKYRQCEKIPRFRKRTDVIKRGVELKNAVQLLQGCA
jgi:hypothetical protein